MENAIYGFESDDNHQNVFNERDRLTSSLIEAENQSEKLRARYEQDWIFG